MLVHQSTKEQKLMLVHQSTKESGENLAPVENEGPNPVNNAAAEKAINNQVAIFMHGSSVGAG